MTACETRARAGNVKERGVPTPKALPNALLHKRMLREPFSVVRNKVTGVSSPLWLSSPDKNLPNLEHVKNTGRYPDVLPDPLGCGRCPKLTRNDDKLAAAETCPCAYLGKSLNTTGALDEGPFEPDPANWTGNVGGHGGSKDARVWFEWLHVQRDSEGNVKPHRVSMLARVAVTRAESLEGGQKSVWETGPNGKQRVMSTAEAEGAPLFAIKYNGRVVSMPPDSVIRMLSEMRRERGQLEPMPKKHALIETFVVDITAFLARQDLTSTDRAPMEKMLAELRAMQKDKVVDGLLYRKTTDALEEGTLDKSTFLPWARAQLRNHLQAMQTQVRSPEEDLKCNAIIELDKVYARMLGVEDDGDVEMRQLLASFSRLSTTSSSSGHGGSSQRGARRR